MPIQFRCTCNQILSAPDGSAGKHAKCPKCSSIVPIPAATPASKPVSPRNIPSTPISSGDLRTPAERPVVVAKPKQAPTSPPVARPIAATPAKPIAAPIAQPTAKPVSQPTAKPVTAPIETPGHTPQPNVQRPASHQSASYQSTSQQPFDPFATQAPTAHTAAKGKPTIPKLPSSVIVGLCGSLLLALAVFLSWPVIVSYLKSGGAGTTAGELATNFQAIESVTKNSNGISAASPSLDATGMLAIAEKFVGSARKNDAPAALGLINRDGFRKRVRSKFGSHAAISNQLSIDQLLDNLDNYSLEKVEADNGRRHWDILGTTQFRGESGVVVRYYVEPMAAPELFRDRERLLQIVELVDLEQFLAAASHVFTSTETKHSGHDSWSLSGHAISKVNPKRVGYLILVFEKTDGQDQLVDVVNMLGHTPYSQSCGKVYLDDYHIFGYQGDRKELFGTKPIELTIYGASALTGGFSAPTGDQEAWDKAKAAAELETARVDEMRPKRLEKACLLFNQKSSKFRTEAKRFRADFPGDLGIELALLINAMETSKPAFNNFSEPYIIDACQRLQETWQDPFLIYTQAVVAGKMGKRSLAKKLFSDARQAGFETTATYEFLIDQALLKSDRKALLAAISGLNEYCKTAGGKEDEQALSRFKTRWNSCYDQLHPQPTLGERMASAGQRGRRFGPSGRMGGFEAGPGRNFDPSSIGKPGDDLSSRSTLPRPGQVTGSRSGAARPNINRLSPNGEPRLDVVTIEITSEQAFDSNAMFHLLRKKLSVANGSSSQRNNFATLTLSFSGPVQVVVNAIDFGTIQTIDKVQRVVKVRIP